MVRAQAGRRPSALRASGAGVQTSLPCCPHGPCQCQSGEDSTSPTLLVWVLQRSRTNRMCMHVCFMCTCVCLFIRTRHTGLAYARLWRLVSLTPVLWPAGWRPREPGVQAKSKGSLLGNSLALCRPSPDCMRPMHVMEGARALLPGRAGAPHGRLRGAPWWRRGDRDQDQDRDRDPGARAGTLRLSSCHVATSGHAGGPKHHVRAVLDPA